MELTTSCLVAATLFAPLATYASRLGHSVAALAAGRRPGGSAAELAPGADLQLGIGLLLGLAVLTAFAIGQEGAAGPYVSYMFRAGGWRWVWLPLGALLGWLVYRMVTVSGGGLALGRASGASLLLRAYAAPWVMPAMAGANLAEEFVWRGFYHKAFTDLGGSLPASVALSSLAYGSYHYTFGLRMCALHALLGGLYSVLFLLARDLTLPFAVHFAFNVMAVRDIRIRLGLVGAGPEAERRGVLE